MGESTTTRLDAWLLRLRDGDEEAFNELLRYFEGRLEGLASKMLKGFPGVAAREQTGDVLQEALMRLRSALKALAAREDGPAGSGSFRGGDFFRYAAQQIRRELLDLAARHARRRSEALPSGDVSPGDARPGASPATWDPEGLALWAEFHEKAAALPDEAREAFDLIYYDGLPQDEVAARLGVSTRTVKSRWQDARLRLADACGGRLPGL